MREFSALFAERNQRLDEWGVPEGRPFLISPEGEYDVELNRYFSPPPRTTVIGTCS